MSIKAQIKKKYFKKNISISKIITHLKNKMEDNISKEKFLDWYGYDYIDKQVLIAPNKRKPDTDQDLITEILNDNFYLKISAKI